MEWNEKERKRKEKRRKEGKEKERKGIKGIKKMLADIGKQGCLFYHVFLVKKLPNKSLLHKNKVRAWPCALL